MRCARHSPRRNTNYEAFRTELARAGIPFLDLNALYREWRDSTPLEVMPRQGIHWSYSSLQPAIGAFVPWAEEQIGVDLADWTWESPPEIDRPLFADRDLLDVLNLRWEPDFGDRYAYPRFRLVDADASGRWPHGGDAPPESRPLWRRPTVGNTRDSPNRRRSSSPLPAKPSWLGRAAANVRAGRSDRRRETLRS